MALLSFKTLSNSSHAQDLSPLVTSICSLLKSLNIRDTNSTEPSSDLLSPFVPHLDTNLVIQVINKQTNPRRALFFFNWASNPSPNPRNYAHNSKCYEAITNLLLSRSLFSIATQFLQTYDKLSDFFVSKLIKAYGDRGNLKAAIFWFHEAKTIEKGKCLFCFNAILGVLVRANKMNLAESFFEQTVREGVLQPDVSTYTTMIRGYCKMGMIDSAKKVFDEMPCEPELLTYNTIINGFCKKGDMETAMSLLNQMDKREECLPNTVTYSTLIDGFCKKGDFDKAMKYMNEMVKLGCEPNVLTYNAIIYALCIRGHLDEAKRMMSKMRLDGLRENVATHNSILKGLCVVGKFQEAIEYFRWMISSKMNPDVKAYSTVVKAHCKVGKPGEAIAILKEMRSGGINPTLHCFNLVFTTLGEHGELDMAILLLIQMKFMGCSPNFMSYSAVIYGLCRAKGRMKDAERVVAEMLQNGMLMDGSMFGRIIEGYCEDGNVERAMQVFKEMIDQKHVISVDSFGVFVKEMCAKKMIVRAEEIFEDMCSRCQVMDGDPYRRVLNEHLCKI